MELSGKRVLITGGARRIGAAVAAAFAAHHAHVTIHCNHSKEEAERLCAALGGTAAGHNVQCADLTEEDVPEQLIRAVRPDILINNASTFERAPFQEESLDAIRRQLEINFYAPLGLMQSFYRERAGKPGVIINLLDQAITDSGPDDFGYRAGKKLLYEATKSAALSYAPEIRVNAVAPGPVLAPPGLEHLGMKTTLKKVPLARSVSPADIAETIIFLAKTDSCTGSVIFTDGGQSLRCSIPEKNL